MADTNEQTQYSYIGKTPLLRALKNPSGQFFLFSQYAEDLTAYLGNTASDMPIPNSFYALKLDKPENWKSIYSTGDEAEVSGQCENIKYRGNINIFGKDKVDGINYNEIYCHIDNDAKKQSFEVNLEGGIGINYEVDNVIGYDNEPAQPELNNFGEYIGEVLQNEYENGNTFFRINQDAINIGVQESEMYNKKYSLARLLYVLKKNCLITIASGNETLQATQQNTISSTPGTAGVLSNWALCDETINGKEYKYFNETNTITKTQNEDEDKFSFNCIIVCYSYQNMTTKEIDDTVEIPMGIYFTGYDSEKQDFANEFTKYVKNLEIYNQGTSYTLRICMRTIASQATEQGSEIVNIISASNTGEWVNEYEQLMCKFDETNDTLEKALETYANLNENILTNLQIFRDGKTNVPYIVTVGEYKYWFVNGVNTGAKVIEAEDYADWSNPSERVVPEITKVTISPVQGETYQIEPSESFEKYIGGTARLIITGTITNIKIILNDINEIYNDLPSEFPYIDGENCIEIDYDPDNSQYILELNDIRGNYSISCNQ